MFGFLRRNKSQTGKPGTDTKSTVPDGTDDQVGSSPAGDTDIESDASAGSGSGFLFYDKTAFVPGRGIDVGTGGEVDFGVDDDGGVGDEWMATPEQGRTDDRLESGRNNGSPESPFVAQPPAAERKRWLSRLRAGMGRTSQSLGSLFTGAQVDEGLYEELETALLTCDAGVHLTEHLLLELRMLVRERRLVQGDQVREALRELLTRLLEPLEQPLDIDRATPLVMMIAGVNGAGKTTSIGKLAHLLQREGKTILLAAGDTFRAAAREQLEQWGQRSGVHVIAQHGGDPAAVAYDAVASGQARGTGVVMVDTAGRLPTQNNLMQELSKIRRVIAKAMPDAPHETLLVLDGNTGQNMLAQTRAFDEAVGLTGLVITKLDGTAKGGALAALAYANRDRPIPVYFIGVGEGVDDLQAFSAAEFAGAMLGT